MEKNRVQQKAMINGAVINFDFMKGDVVATKEDYVKGVVKKVDNPFVYIDWIDEEAKKKRGEKWLVSSLIRVNS
ncbi:Uncharacterised protein [[Flavobacterium] thermophilum]|nr:Uncharacterised protein [[Flavobacterium] thermophilum]